MRNIHVKLYEIWTCGLGDFLMIFLIWSSGGRLFSGLEPICAIEVEGIKKNNSVNFFLNLD